MSSPPDKQWNIVKSSKKQKKQEIDDTILENIASPQLTNSPSLHLLTQVIRPQSFSPPLTSINETEKAFNALRVRVVPPQLHAGEPHPPRDAQNDHKQPPSPKKRKADASISLLGDSESFLSNNGSDSNGDQQQFPIDPPDTINLNKTPLNNTPDTRVHKDGDDAIHNENNNNIAIPSANNDHIVDTKPGSNNALLPFQTTTNTYDTTATTKDTTTRDKVDAIDTTINNPSAGPLEHGDETTDAGPDGLCSIQPDINTSPVAVRCRRGHSSTFDEDGRQEKRRRRRMNQDGEVFYTAGGDTPCATAIKSVHDADAVVAENADVIGKEKTFLPQLGSLLAEFGKIELNKDFYDAIKRTESHTSMKKSALQTVEFEKSMFVFDCTVEAAKEKVHKQVERILQERKSKDSASNTENDAEFAVEFLRQYALEMLALCTKESKNTYFIHSFIYIVLPSTTSIALSIHYCIHYNYIQ